MKTATIITLLLVFIMGFCLVSHAAHDNGKERSKYGLAAVGIVFLTICWLIKIFWEWVEHGSGVFHTIICWLIFGGLVVVVLAGALFWFHQKFGIIGVVSFVAVTVSTLFITLFVGKCSKKRMEEQKRILEIQRRKLMEEKKRVEEWWENFGK